MEQSMAPHAPLGFLYVAVVLLATVVVVVAIARRLRLSPIVAYLGGRGVDRPVRGRLVS
jgi:predicted Kef-type K+ transport protein